MKKEKMWDIKNTKEVYRCKIARINEMNCYLKSKNIANTFYSMDLSDWVNIFSIDENNQVIMVKQHRLGKNIVTLEVPAGTIDKNETPETAAKRELQEETGYVPENLILLKSINVNPAIQTNICYFFLATGCKKLKEVSFDPTEEMELEKIPLEEVLNARTNDLVNNSVTLLSIMLAKDYLKESQGKTIHPQESKDTE